MPQVRLQLAGFRLPVAFDIAHRTVALLLLHKVKGCIYVGEATSWEGMVVHGKGKKSRCLFVGILSAFFMARRNHPSNYQSDFFSSGRLTIDDFVCATLRRDSHLWTGTLLLCLARNLYQVFPSKLHLSRLAQLFQVRSIKTLMFEGLQRLDHSE